MERESDIRSIIDGLSLGYALCDVITDERNQVSEYRFCHISELFSAIIHLMPDQIVDTRVDEILSSMIDPDYDWKDLLNDTVKNSRERKIERYSKSLDKHLRLYFYSHRPNNLIIVLSDYSDQAKPENFDSQNELIRSIINSFIYPFYIIDTSSHSIVMTNVKSEGRQALMDKKCYEVSHHIRHSCRLEPGHECPMERVVETKKPFNVEHIHYDRNNNPYQVMVYAYPLFDSENRVDRIIEYSIDMTELNESAENLKKYTMELEDKNRQLSEIAFAAAHTLREPIRNIVSFLQLIIARYQAPIADEIREFFNYAINGAMRMNDMILGLMKYSDLDQDSSEYEDIDPNAVIERTFDELKELIEQTHAEFQIDKLPPFKGNVNQIFLLFFNLIHNALHYRKDSENPVVKIYARSDLEAQIEFTVEDNGIGIADEYHQRVFEMFYRLHTQEKYPGIGMGLSICKNIVYKHFGNIHIKSKENVGTKVIFTVYSKLNLRNIDYGRYVGYTRDLIEREKINLRLSRIKERLEFAIDGSNIGLWDWDMSTGSVYFSSRWKNMLGYEDHEIENFYFEWEERLHPDDRAYALKTVSDYVNGETSSYMLEHRLLCKDGTYKWIQGRGKIISRTEDGKPLRFIGTHIDITERKMAEQALMESEKSFSSYFHNAPDGIFIVDRFGRYIDVNPSACKQTGYTLEELKKMSVMDLSHPDSLESGREHFEQVLNTGYATVDIKYIKKDGTTGYWEVSAVALDHNRFIGFHKDITQRKLNEMVYTTMIELTEYSEHHTISELLTKFLDESEKLTDSNIGFFHFIHDDQKTIMLQTWSTNTMRTMCKAQPQTEHYPVDQGGVWVDAVRARKPVVHNDYESLPHKKGMPEGHAPIVREVVVPVFRGDKIKAILGVGNKPTDYTDFDVEIIQKLADLAWEIVSKMRTDLALRENEERLKKAQTIAKIGSWDFDIINGQLIWSDEVFRIFGMEIANHPLDPDEFFNRLHPDDKDFVNQAFWDAVNNGTQYELLHRIVVDNQTKYVHERCEIYYDDQGTAYRALGTIHDITDLKTAELSLAENEGRLRSLINSTPDIICFKDGEGRWLVANEADLELFYLTDVDYHGKTDAELAELTHPIYKQAFLNCIHSDEEAWKNKTISRGTEVILKPDGEEKIYDVIKVPMFEENGKRSGLVVLGRDITELKIAEEALKESEQRLRSLINSTPDFICFKDGKGRWLDANDAGLELYGLDKNNYRGKTDSELAELTYPIYREGFKICKLSDEKAWTSKESHVRTEESVPLQDGGVRIFDVIKVPIFNPKGERHALVVLGRDITELKKTEADLLESRKRWQFAIEGSDFGLWDWNVQTNEVFYSKRWKSMLGYNDMEIENHLREWEKRIHPDDLKRTRAVINNCLFGKTSFYLIEFRMLCKDGSYKWIQARGRIMEWSSDGKPLRFIGTHVDISEQKKVSEEKAEKQRLLDLFFSQSMDAFYIMMLDKPQIWNDTIDKDKTLEYILKHQRFTKLNSALLQQYGAQTELQIIDLVPYDFFKHDMNHGKDAWGSFLDKGRIHIDTKQEKIDGTPMTIEGDYICLYDDEGRITGHFGVQRDVTEERNRAELLIQSENKYRSLYESMREGVTLHELVYDDSGKPVNYRVIDHNPAYVKILGLNTDDVKGKLATDLYHRDSPPNLEAFTEVALTGKSAQFDLYSNELDKWFSVSAFSPEKGRFATITEDITLKVGMMETLRSNEEKLLKAQYMSKTGDFSLDLETKKIAWSRGLYKILDYDPLTEISYEMLKTKIFHPDDRKIIDRWMDSAIRSGKRHPEPLDYRLIKSGGEMIYVHAEIEMIFLNDQPKKLFGTVQDITQRKSMENILAERNRSLENAERLANAGSWVWISENEECKWSPGLFRLLGLDEQTTDYGFTTLLDSVYPEDRSIVESAIKESFEKGSFEIEFRIVRTDNREIHYIHAVGEYIEDSITGVKTHYGMGLDITERKQAEKSLLESQRLQAIGEFASGVAHDFNNSLESILGNIDLMLYDTETPESNRQNLLVMKNSVKDASARIKKLQSFGSPENRRFNYVPVNLNRIIEDVINQSRPLWKDNPEKSGYSIKIDIETDPGAVVNGNENELRSAVYNLVKNSIEAMPEGGNIRIVTSIRDNMVYVTIADTGTGIEQELQCRIFEPFFSTKGFEAGRGLGLSGVYSVLNDHQGRICIKSSVSGEGTVIEFSIPQFVEVQPDVMVDQKPISNDQKMHILWVDDEPAIRSLGKKRLEFLGHSADTAEDGEEALAKIANSEFDLVITDIGMQGMSGWTLADRIREKYGDTLLIAVLSGWGLEQLSADMKKHKVDFILHKPVDLEELKSFLDRIIREK